MKKVTLKIAVAQMAPVWLDKSATIEKIARYVKEAGKNECRLVAFGEALLPGYPHWLSLTDGAVFDSRVQKELHAHYISNAVQLESGDLDPICKIAEEFNIAVYLGTVERAENRGGHSLYCSLVYIDSEGVIQSVHRKLQPTYEERLTWSQGDGHGLTVHELGGFTLGGLNCWENWMPLSRTALYGMGENLHVAVWPGSERNTSDITRFIARESRSFVVSVSGIMRRDDFPPDTPHLGRILDKAPQVLADGGSCIAGPDGSWILKPFVNREGLETATLELDRVFEERQNFDLPGHYSRPDVTRLEVNKTRQSIVRIENSDLGF